MGWEDRLARLLIALLLVYYWLTTGLSFLGILALVLFLEFLFSFCLINAALRRSTCPLPDPTAPWYKRFNWLTWVVGVLLIIGGAFLGFYLYLLYAFRGSSW